MKGNLLFVLLAASMAAGIKVPQRPVQPLHWWDEEMIYQIYPRSHMDSDGDGIGDLEGIESKLDYFLELGVKAVWISPIYESPMKDFGYDISNFTNIDPIFGNMDSFKSLSAALKTRGIKLVMDFVPNHSSDEHPWFKASVERVEPYTDFYVWKDPKGYDKNGHPIPPTNWVSVFGGSMWEWNNVRQQFYLHQFVAGQPDLNFENHNVLIHILGAAKFWLDMGVDGFRFDAVSQLFEDQQYRDEPENPNRPPGSLPTEYAYWSHPYTYDLNRTLNALADFRKLIDVYSVADGQERCMMVEVTTVAADDVFEYYGTSEMPIAHFPFNFDFIRRLDFDFKPSELQNLIDEWLTEMPKAATANWLVGNHDRPRISGRFGNYAVDMFNMIIHLLPGSSVTYYGEEIGMQNAEISWEDTVDPAGCNAGRERYALFSRDPVRTPMQWDDSPNAGFSTGSKTWLPLHPNYRNLNVAAQNQAEESHLRTYKRISQLRKTNAWKFGSLETITINHGSVFAYSRIFENDLQNEGFVVLANFGDSQVTVDSTQLANVPNVATIYARSLGFSPDTMKIGDRLQTMHVVMGPKTSLILRF